ncbi:hypothetical protein PC129_g6379 [Phytophthora cactorum]|uniref:Uncharacterized protein n=1 Tax=Phytophthora cactorum TaxID=29920 RepID=A0A8T1IF90_9STRA|nr:hypothetical protein PC111_g7029 [Phytophthora cactorum]KAG2846385.1 hypothetical protein PC112_g1503 [Phytophthora cactorum]KAG2918074.1 hypothetical protein PC114_g6924 [Phytophthora cactorum]KAG2987044.1 hypothetical protein PC118_g7496 [Phytophthora cactorum]KAG3175892.1 hypothetical protein C6341_g9245 [Phytophthora cactorum]
MTEPFSFASVLNPWQETQDENVVSNHHPQQHIESSRNRRRNPDPFGKPSELLQQIGLRGKEVVKILKERDWDVCDPKALQEHKLYYVPGGRAKGELAVQGEDFFVGEGELYAYILDKGGVHFLLPDEGYSTETKMDSESDFEILDQPPPRLEGREIPAELLQETSDAPKTTSDPWQPKRKRRKKLLIANGKTAAKAKPAKRQVRKPRQKIDAKAATFAVECLVKEEKNPFVFSDGCGHFAEFGAYEAALTARGWRAQLLQDIDLHLLRSVAAIARRQVALEVASGEQNHFCCDREDSGLHEGVHQELKVLSSGIKASQNDLSSMIAVIIQQAERIHSPERAECAARIGISGFVPTGSGNLMLMRDMERHLLLIVAAVRQYLRTKSVSSYSGGQVSTSKRSDLRALQLNIEKMNAELTELSTIISAQAETLSQKSPTTPMELDADVETDSEQWLV